MERVDVGTERIYLIDYEKRLQNVYLKGKKKGKAIVSDSTKVDNILEINKSKGIVVQHGNDEYKFNAKYEGKKGVAVIKKNGELYELWFEGKPIGLNNKTSFEIKFSDKETIIEKSIGAWKVIEDKPELYLKYVNAPYIESEIYDDVKDEDIEGALGKYTPECVHKRELKKSKDGKKIYPRDRKYLQML